MNGDFFRICFFSFCIVVVVVMRRLLVAVFVGRTRVTDVLVGWSVAFAGWIVVVVA